MEIKLNTKKYFSINPKESKKEVTVGGKIERPKRNQQHEANITIIILDIKKY